MEACMTVLGPPIGVLVVVWGMDMGPVPITKPKNGSGFVPTMGLDGAVCRSSSYWYDFESDSEAVCPSDGLEARLWS